MFGFLCLLYDHKLGNTADEYEDAAAVYPPELTNGEIPRELNRFRIAISDGATESFLAGRWAKLLVENGTHRTPTLRETVRLAALDWQPTLDEYVDIRTQQGRPIRWYEEPGLAKGAYATLLIIDFWQTEGQTGEWRAEGIGDSSFFHVRGQELMTSFPFTSSREYTTSPDLLHTRALDLDRVEDHLRRAHGTWQSGDSFYLCTDALAAWFLSSYEQHGTPWATWGEFDQSLFDEWATSERGNNRLKNDDLTMVRLDFY